MKLPVILVEPEGPANIGMVARTMKNFGFPRLALVNPSFTEESYSYAVHATDVLGRVLILKDFGKALALVDLAVGTTGKPGKDYIPVRVPLMPRELKEALKDYPGRVGLFFGRESIDLKNEELEKLNFTVMIPTSRAYPVMNLAQAVAVILYELSKEKPKPAEESLMPATVEEKGQLVGVWRELLEALDYPKELERRFVGKAALYGRGPHPYRPPQEGQTEAGGVWKC
ncbi:RNA methyltransferase [Thermococcus sp.]|uniref:RNA methyltransferase n=1 Tax=Thermococcus sp. TaxID=35749 RepID=UPI0034147FE1